MKSPKAVFFSKNLKPPCNSAAPIRHRAHLICISPRCSGCPFEILGTSRSRSFLFFFASGRVRTRPDSPGANNQSRAAVHFLHNGRRIIKMARVPIPNLHTPFLLSSIVFSVVVFFTVYGKKPEIETDIPHQEAAGETGGTRWIRSVERIFFRVWIQISFGKEKKEPRIGLTQRKKNGFRRFLQWSLPSHMRCIQFSSCDSVSVDSDKRIIKSIVSCYFVSKQTNKT